MKLAEYIEKQKQNIVSKNFTLEGNLLLNFDDLIDTDVKSITIDSQV
ncbi:hypothetical protein KKG31_00120 [Patescibacteria group bacterium]|nr:hypothetical protein [Patescibacteria group bacterium]MBU1757596.1 hypothetical protein [Patescibacteria group bacterium]